MSFQSLIDIREKIELLLDSACLNEAGHYTIRTLELLALLSDELVEISKRQEAFAATIHELRPDLYSEFIRQMKLREP